MEIEIRELQNISNQLFNYLIDLGIDTIEITEDFYWFIQKENLYNPYKKPLDLDLGQLSDDWDDLKKISDGKNEPISYDFVDLSAILRYIGEIELSFLLSKIKNKKK